MNYFSAHLSSSLIKDSIFLCRHLTKLTHKSVQMSSNTPITDSIKHKLSTNLNTVHLDVINESYMHNVPKGSETHFKVVVVTEKFKDLALIKRHRLVNDLLKEELNNGVHALSIVAKTPDQWATSDQIVESSPNCRGGFGK